MKVGGISNAEPANNEIQTLSLSFKAQVEAQSHTTYSSFQAVKYTKQVVAGMNYKIKVKADQTYIHLSVFKPLPHTNQPATLNQVQLNKSENDPL